tara:strand:- start:705 stop:2012 length:1308 start_codon:yes stop_codon:yes gene_type:complete
MFFFICYKLDKNITDNELFFNECNKFKIYKKLINTNYNDNEIKLFTNAQKIYHILNNFVFKYKLKNFKPGNESDMYLDIIDIHNKNTIKLIIDNRLYLFTIKDIIYIINNNLLYSKSSNINPLKIKNPYTNNVIKMHNLYNIFFSLKNRNIFNQIFYILYKKNFNIENLQIEYKYLLFHNLFIYNINHSSDKYLFDNIIKMFDSLSDYFNIIYFLKYNEQIIIKKYKNLLIHYFIYTCKESSISTSINNKITLIKKLFNLIEKDKIFYVLKKNEIFRLIHYDYLNDDYLSYLVNDNNINLSYESNNTSDNPVNIQSNTINEPQDYQSDSHNHSNNEEQLPIQQYQSSIPEHQSPIPEHQSPIPEHQSPIQQYLHRNINNKEINKNKLKFFKKIILNKTTYLISNIILNLSLVIFKIIQIFVIFNSFYNIIKINNI